MNEKEVLATVNVLVWAKKGKTLDHIERIILQESWHGKTYKEIYQNLKNRMESPHSVFKFKNIA